MKILGKFISGPTTEVLVIPRGNDEFVIKAQAVLDFTDCEQINPMPQPPMIMRPGGVTQKNVEDPKYLKALETWSQQKTDWMILKSLSATEGLEWETVDISNPATWANYRSELEQTFTASELSMILGIVMTACGLNQAKIEEATKRFLATQGHNQ